MKVGVNEVTLIGNLGQDPSFQKFSDGNAVLSFSVATGERWMDRNGQMQERTEWHRVSIFGKRAETCQKYLTKGLKVYIKGKLQTRKYVDKQNIERYSTEVVVTGYDGEVQFLSPRQQGEAAQNAGNQAGGQSYPPRQQSDAQKPYTERPLPPQGAQPQTKPPAGYGYQNINPSDPQGYPQNYQTPPTNPEDDFLSDDIPF